MRFGCWLREGAANRNEEDRGGDSLEEAFLVQAGNGSVEKLSGGVSFGIGLCFWSCRRRLAAGSRHRQGDTVFSDGRCGVGVL